MCEHRPSCPTTDSPRALRAVVLSPHPEQGWVLLCNGVVLFDDGGALLPNRRVLNGTVTEPAGVRALAARCGNPPADPKRQRDE